MWILFFSFLNLHQEIVDTLQVHFTKRFNDTLDEYIVSLPVSMDYYDGKIFICDLKERRIMVYDTLGYFVRQIGRPGQAPDELSSPGAIKVKNKRVFVMDGRKVIKVYDIKGNYIKSIPIRVYTTGRFFEISREEYIYLPSPGKGRLISKIDSTGELVLSFGKPIPPPRGKAISAWDAGIVMLSNTEDSIFYLFNTAPILHVYNREGKLLREYKIYSPLMKEKIDWQHSELRKRGNGKFTEYLLFNCADFVNNTVYIWGGKAGHMFLVDTKGNINKVFYLEKISERDYWGFPMSFCVSPDGKIWRIYPGGICYYEYQDKQRR